MTNLRDNQRDSQSRDSRFESRNERPRGEVVEVDGSIAGPAGSIHLWVRPLEPNASPKLEFNPGAIQRPVAGMAVHSAKWPESQTSPWRLLEFDLSTYAGDLSTLISLVGLNMPPHGFTHEMPPGSIGPDPMNVYTHAITDLSVRPTSPFSMKLQIEGGWYKSPVHSGSGFYNRLISQKTEDLTARIPSTTGKAKLVAVCLDPGTGLLVYIEGTEYAFGADPFPASAFSDVPSTLILLSDVLLFNGMTQVTSVEFEKERRPLFGSTSPGSKIDEAMHWLNVWIATTYFKNDTVRDGDWAMVANKETTDRAAPQTVGSPFFEFPDVPPWTVTNRTGYILTANEYTILAGLYTISQARYWVENAGPQFGYSLQIRDVTDPADQIELFSSDLEVPILTGWRTLDLEPSVIFVQGRVYQVILFALNTASTTPFSGQWTREGNSQAGDPATGNWLTNNTFTRLAIHKFDDAAADRSADLVQFIPGTLVQYTSVATPTRTVTFTIDTNPVDTGVAFEWDVHISDGTLTDVGDLTDMDATVPVAGGTDTVSQAGYWTANPPPAGIATVQGILSINGGAPTIDDTAYGTDIFAQLFTVSLDWDLLAVSGGTAGGGGGAGVETWLELLDTPGSFATEALQGVRVNAAETALEFFTVPSGGSAHVIKDEGISLANRAGLNFVGAGVTATDAVGPDETVVTIPGSTDRHVIQDETTPLADQPNLNFAGAGVVATDDAGNSATLVTIAGSTDRHVIQDEGTPQTDQPNLNFVGAGVTVTNDGPGTASVVTIPGPTTEGHIIQEEGTPLTQRLNLNFIGADFTAADDVGNNATTITLDPYPTVIPRHIIQDETVPLADQPNLNFEGGGVTVTDDGINNATLVTIPSGGSTTFLALTDTPSAYDFTDGQFLRVNDAADAIQFESTVAITDVGGFVIGPDAADAPTADKFSILDDAGNIRFKITTAAALAEGRLVGLDQGANERFDFDTGTTGFQASMRLRDSNATARFLINSGNVSGSLAGGFEFRDVSSNLRIQMFTRLSTGDAEFMMRDASLVTQVRILAGAAGTELLFLGEVEPTGLPTNVASIYGDINQTFTSATPSDRPIYRLNRARALQSAIVAGDALGAFVFSGYTGAIWQDVAEIEGIATVNATNINADIVFKTRKTTAFTEKMRLTSDGFLGVNTDAPEQELHVLKSGAVGSPTAQGRTVAMFQNNANTTDFAAISIVAGIAGHARVDFGNSSSATVGSVYYVHGDNELHFMANLADRLVITQTSIDFLQNELHFPVIHPLATPPSVATEVTGQLYFDTTLGLGVWDSTQWVYLGSAGSEWTRVVGAEDYIHPDSPSTTTIHVGALTFPGTTHLVNAVRSGTASMMLRDTTVTASQSAMQFFFGHASASGALIEAVREAGQATATSLRFHTNNATALTEMMRIQPDGKVGINITAPEAVLHVFDGEASVAPFGGTMAVFENSANGYISLLTPAASESGIFFGSPTSSIDGGIIYNNSALPRGMQFRVSGNSTKMVILSSGKIGFDTTTIPHAAIGMAKWAFDGTWNNVSGPHMQFSTTQDNYPTLNFYNIGHNNIWIAFDAHLITTTDWRSSGDVNFRIGLNGSAFRIDKESGIAQGSAITWDSAMYINTSGQVGIGNAAPSTKLHVTETAGSHGAIIGVAYIGNFTTATFAQFSHSSFRTGATDYALLHSSVGETILNSAGVRSIFFRNTNVTRMTMTSAGLFGIGGTATPAHTLELFDDDAAKTVTTTWATTSDPRTKKNVTPYTKGLDLIAILPQPVNFEYNGEFGTPDGVAAIGFLGDQLQQLGTSLTRANDDGVISFNPHELFFIFVNALKDVIIRLDNLDDAVEDLQEDDDD